MEGEGREMMIIKLWWEIRSSSSSPSQSSLKSKLIWSIFSSPTLFILCFFALSLYQIHPNKCSFFFSTRWSLHQNVTLPNEKAPSDKGKSTRAKRKWNGTKFVASKRERRREKTVMVALFFASNTCCWCDSDRDDDEERRREKKNPKLIMKK